MKEYPDESETAVEEILRLAKNWEGFDDEINLPHISIHITGNVVWAREGQSDLDSLSLIFYDVSTGFAHPVGAMRLLREQWEKMKEVVDLLLKDHGISA